MTIFTRKDLLNSYKKVKNYNENTDIYNHDRRILIHIYKNIGKIKPIWIRHKFFIFFFPLLPIDWVYQKCYDVYLKIKIYKLLKPKSKS